MALALSMSVSSLVYASTRWQIYYGRVRVMTRCIAALRFYDPRGWIGRPRWQLAVVRVARRCVLDCRYRAGRSGVSSEGQWAKGWFWRVDYGMERWWKVGGVDRIFFFILITVVLALMFVKAIALDMIFMFIANWEQGIPVQKTSNVSFMEISKYIDFIW